MNTQPVFGAILSDVDYRDKMAAAAIYAAVSADAATLPQSLLTDLAALGDALDQNKMPACVSHAWALVMKWYWWKKTGKVIDFSARYLDIMSWEDWIPLEGGRVPRTVAKISAKYGCCTTALLPNDTEGLTLAQYRDKTVITQAMHDEAAQYKIPGYVRIADEHVDDFRKGVQLYGLVSGLFSVGNELWTPSWATSEINPLKVPVRVVSGHQMVVRGWDGLLNRLRNSWSKLWNKNGEGDYDPQAWLPFIAEGWAIAEMPQNMADLLKTLPAPADFHYQWNKDLEQGNTTPDDDVKFAQVALMITGFLKPVAPEQMGYFGPKTAAAVMAYQSSKKLSTAGRIGPKTRAALNAQFAL